MKRFSHLSFRWPLAALTLVLMLALPWAVLADQVVNDIDTTIDPALETRTITAGGSTVVGFYIRAITGGGDASGCNATGADPATVNLSVPAGVTASPTSLTFTGCGIVQNVTFSSSTVSSYNITVASVTGGKSGSLWDTAPAAFTLIVNPPPDTTPPVISYVLTPASPDGGNGWYKSNVTLVWSVTDPESAVTKTGCVDQNITADQAATNYSCSATSAGGSAGPVSVSIQRDATAPGIIWSGSINNGDSFVYGSVPAAPTCSATDSLSGPDTCTVTGYGTSAGSHTLTATATDKAGNVKTESRSYTVSKADATCSVSGYSGVYDAAYHGASGSCTGVGGDGTLSGLDLGATFKDVPGGTANWTFSGGTNYNNQSGSVAIVISKADASCSVSGYTGVYDAAYHGASGSCTGIGGESAGALNLGVTFKDVPGGTAHWAFTGNGNYNDQSGDVAITITKADATCSVSGYTGVYDAAYHGASGSCSGIGGEDAGMLSLGASFKNVPGGTAHWAFTGNGNYNDQSGDVAITITKADATCSVSGYSGVYDAAYHGASGSCSGIGGENAGTLDLGATFKNVPGGTAHWVFTGNGNYNDQSGDVAITITKADATCSVTGYSVTYDGAAHTATGSCTGVKGESLSGLDLSGTTHTNAGSYTDSWSFTDVTGNYNNASGTVNDNIAKANATCSVTGYSVYYDGAAHTATGSCTGVKGESLSGLDLSGTTHTNVGTYTDTWIFTDSTGNYKNASGTVTDKILAWTLKGFYQPVDMSGSTLVYNTVKNGSTVPFKFEIFAGATELTDVSFIKSFTSALVACTAGTEDAIEETVTTTGGTTLRYDTTAGQFINNWKTPSTAGKCYRVTMTTLDSSTLVAYFKLK